MRNILWFIPFLLLLIIGGSYGKFGGTFMWTESIPQSEITAYLTEIQGLGMNTVIVQYTRQVSQCPNGGESASYYSWTTPTAYINSLLTIAASKSINVIMGLTETETICDGLNGHGVFYNAPNIALTAADTKAAVATILGLGAHTALKGWYIPDEPSIMVWDDPVYTYDYYSAIVQAIKAHSTLPTYVSPYLNGANATRNAAWASSQALLFKQGTGIDIQIWQDSVGAAAINIYNRPGDTLADFFGNISKAIGKANLWSDLEAYNYGTDLSGASGGYRACSAWRMLHQFQQTNPYVSQSVTWIQQRHFGTIDADRYPEAARLLGEYRSTIIQSPATYTYLPISSYKWNTAPSASYPDTATPSKLSNHFTADPLRLADVQWVGVLGNAQVVLDFGRQVTVTWIGVHTLTNTGAAIYTPTSLQLAVSNTSTTWVNLPVINSPIDNYSDSEYVLGNTAALAKRSFRYLQVHLANTHWTFVSEIECVGTLN